MNRDDFLKQSKTLFWLFSASGLLAYKMYNSFKSFRHGRKRAQQLIQEQVQDRDYQNLKGVGKRIVLLKLTCINQQKIPIRSEVGIIKQMYDCYPILENTAKLLNSSSELQIRWLSKQLNHKQMLSKSPLKFIQIKQRLKFGKIVDDSIFTVKHFYSQDKRGLFMDFIVFLGALVSFIGNACIGTYGERSYFHGPTVGFLVSNYQLITDKPIVVQCLVQDGQIIPRVMGATKKSIIDWYSSQSKADICMFALYSVLFYFLSSYTKNKAKQLINKMFQPKPNRDKFQPLDIQESLKCTVCMNKCRDVIFQNCKHFFICSDCLNLNPRQFQKCPICRQPVKNKILFVEQMKKIQEREV